MAKYLEDGGEERVIVIPKGHCSYGFNKPQCLVNLPTFRTVDTHVDHLRHFVIVGASFDRFDVFHQLNPTTPVL